MAATYSKVPHTVPSSHRTALITAVVVGDQIDIVDVLGRPARGLKLVTTSSTDSVSYRLNSLVRVTSHNESSADSSILIWSAGPGHSVFSDTGAEIVTQDQLEVSSIEITALSLSTGTEIEIVAW